MRVPWNILFDCFFVLLLTYMLISCNAIAYQTKSAWNQYNQAVAQVEESHFEPEVIEEVIQEGNQLGYQMTIMEDNVYDDTERYLVKLSYKIAMPILQFEKTREISGYAI